MKRTPNFEKINKSPDEPQVSETNPKFQKKPKL